MDAILKLHTKIGDEKLGVQQVREELAREREALLASPTSQMKGLLA
mgnify:FL=1